MSGDFLDSNVLVYMFDRTDVQKGDIAAGLVEAGMQNGAVVSFQVVQETLNVITRRIPKPASPREAKEFLDRVMVPLWKVFPNSELYTHALALQERYRFHFYDSLVVAAALGAGCTRLLTEDLQDGQRIEGLTIVNPFK